MVELQYQLQHAVNCVFPVPEQQLQKKDEKVKYNLSTIWKSLNCLMVRSWKVQGSAVQFLSAPGQHLSHFRTGPSVHREDKQEAVQGK